MKWLSVLALCAAFFIAATHASQLQDEEMMDRAVKEKILQMLLANQIDTENDDEIEQADEETAAVYKGRISAARDKANVQCVCRCNRTRQSWPSWQKASKAQSIGRTQCGRCCNDGVRW